MSTEDKNKQFDCKIEPYDWRYSAAIVGLHKYFSYFGKENIDFKITEDTFEYCSEDITEKKLLKFVEYYYGTQLQHRKIEQLLKKNEFSEEECKRVNELLQANSVLKKTFNKTKFDKTNQKDLLNIIDENRENLIKETFRNKKNMYANYANTNLLFSDSQERCRLLGYYVDGGRKSKAISYNFDTKSFVGQDTQIFDFIPFAFMGDRESFFINDNFTVIDLIRTNTDFEKEVNSALEEARDKGQDNVDTRKVLFQLIQKTSEFLNYDVEIIFKNRENEFFETMYVRKKSIDILKHIKNYNLICRSYKVSDNYYLNVQKEVLNCILNLVRTDYLIELYLKEKSEYIVKQLITINTLICGGGEKMKQSMKTAYATAKEVSKKLPENKIDSYRQKLISSIVFKDYDRCCQILLQLSNYADVPFHFAYDLFDDFEENKDIAYTFINALTVNRKEEE